jgi:hypothetical protein
MKKFKYTLLKRYEDGTIVTTEVEVEAEWFKVLDDGTLKFADATNAALHLVQPEHWQSVWVV